MEEVWNRAAIMLKWQGLAGKEHATLPVPGSSDWTLALMVTESNNLSRFLWLLASPFPCIGKGMRFN